MKNIKHIIVFQLFFLGINAFSQSPYEGHVGVNTDTPTEIIDIKGTLRIRKLPNDGESNSIYTTGINTNSGNSPTQTFNAQFPVVNNTNYNVIGKTDKADLVPNNTSLSFNTNDDSKAMFVIKRFSIGDWPSGSSGFNTGMSVSKWEAILSSVSYEVYWINAVANMYSNGAQHLWSMKGQANGTWRIIGDLNGVQERSYYVDVLFIRKNNIAADDRTN